MVMTDNGGMMAESNFAAVFVPLATAQDLTGHPDMVNDLVLTLKSGADRETVQKEIAGAMSAAFPEVTVTFLTPKDDAAYNELYNDVSGDQSMYMVVAYLFLAGAAFGAFNLASRMVEAQRREIGIGMALGMPDEPRGPSPAGGHPDRHLGFCWESGRGAPEQRVRPAAPADDADARFRTPFQPALRPGSGARNRDPLRRHALSRGARGARRAGGRDSDRPSGG